MTSEDIKLVTVRVYVAGEKYDVVRDKTLSNIHVEIESHQECALEYLAEGRYKDSCIKDLIAAITQFVEVRRTGATTGQQMMPC